MVCPLGGQKKKAHLLLNLWMTKKKDQEIHPKFLPPRSVMSYWGARLLSTVLKTCGTRSYLGGSDRLRPMAGPPQDPEAWPCTAQKRLMCHDRDGTQMASFRMHSLPGNCLHYHITISGPSLSDRTSPTHLARVLPYPVISKPPAGRQLGPHLEGMLLAGRRTVPTNRPLSRQSPSLPQSHHLEKALP